MAFFLLDTSVVIDHLNGRFGRTEFLKKLVAQGSELATCSVVITEIYAGLRSGEEAKTAALVDSMRSLPITPQTAKTAGLLMRDWKKKGRTLSYTDATIAAVAIVHEIELLTDNRKHFPMSELRMFRLPERER